MKLVKDVLSQLKGEKNVNETVTGKGTFSKSHFADLTNALVNDTTYKVRTVGKDGKPIEVSISDLIRSDMKKSLANAKYPQKPEEAVLDSSEIFTAGLAEAIPHIVLEQMKTGRKFSLPSQENFVGDIYLQNVPGRTRTVQVRDMKTKEDMGTAIITTKDSVQLRAKSPVPKSLQTKIRKDKNGNLIK